MKYEKNQLAGFLSASLALPKNAVLRASLLADLRVR